MTLSFSSLFFLVECVFFTTTMIEAQKVTTTQNSTTVTTKPKTVTKAQLCETVVPRFMVEKSSNGNESQIVSGGSGGEEPPQNSRMIPWQVSIQRNGKHFCGGTIISPKIILSAASCFHPEHADAKRASELT